MINTVWQVFPSFLIAFVIKRLLYIGFRVFRKKRKRKLEVHNGLERLLPIFDFGSRQRILYCDNGFWCRDTFSLGPARHARSVRSAGDSAHDSHPAHATVRVQQQRAR